MNISILAPHRDTDKWTIPISFANEFIKLTHRVKFYSTFDASDNYCEDGLVNLLTDARSGAFRPDIIIVFDFGLFTSSLLSYDAFPDAVWILESGDDPQNFYLNRRKLIDGKFDIILTPDIRCARVYEQINNNTITRRHTAIWSPHFADESLFIGIHELPIYDAVTSRSIQEPFFAELKNRLGSKFEARTKFLEGIDHTSHLLKGKIVVQNSKHKEITRRIFEGMLANRLVITDRLPKETGIDQIFIEGEDIIYFDNIDDCVDKINFFAENEKERLRISQNGYNKVRQRHTVRHRVSRLLKYVYENFIYKSR